MANKRQSYGLTLPKSPSVPDSVVSNILSSLATLDETAKIHRIEETSRQVDYERAYQREENTRNSNGYTRERYGGHSRQQSRQQSMTDPLPSVGYRDRSRDRSRNGSFTIINASAPSPSVPMGVPVGRPAKQGFFRRFMGMGPKVPTESDLLISSQPNVLRKNQNNVQVREIRQEAIQQPPPTPVQPPEESRPVVKKKSSNFFRRRPKSSGDGAVKSNTFNDPHPPPLPVLPTAHQDKSRQASFDAPMTSLRKTIETYKVPNGSNPTSPAIPQSRERAQSSPRQVYPQSTPRLGYPVEVLDLRHDTNQMEITSQTSEIFEKGNHSRLASTATTTSPIVETPPVKKSPLTDKAKQLTGMDTMKPLHTGHRTVPSNDGNIAALENEYSDVSSPQNTTFTETVKGEENGVSLEEDRVKETARDIYNGTEIFVALGDAARWLMNSNEFNSKVRTAYMELYDFMGLDILTAVRRLCGRLLLRGETQQLDRILETLAKRWYECNPENGMKEPDVVHAISYSIFLLNTDLHIVDISSSQRMTRQQFVRNTLETILSQLPKSKRISTVPTRPQTSVPKGKLTAFPSASSPNLSHLVTTPNLTRSGSLLRVGQAVGMVRNPSAQSLDHGTGRLSKESNTAERLSWTLFDDKVGPFGGMASLGSQTAWESQMECVLKDIYNSVKTTPLQQAQSTPNDSNTSVNSKPVGLGLNRSTSMMSHISQASETGSSKARNPVRNMISRDWLGRSKSQPRLPQYPQESHVSIHSERSSMEKSPPNSSQHVRSSSHGRSPSATSMQSFNTYPDGGSIGFANSLSHTIIREEAHSSQTFIDEEIQEHALILSGPPWAKEGVLKSKRHLEANLKKSKEKGWKESFVVIDKGQMRLFQFDSHRLNTANHVGGGNWQKNANMVGSFLLRQTLASALPSPGYSRQRQHVWALTLPSGGVFFFEAGTPELVKEWVASANYWAARTSKEPLMAGVSNMEWGWGDCLAMSEDDATDDGNSVVESHRSTFEARRSPTGNGKATYGADGHGLKGDKVIIRDWKPPQQSLMGSSLKEKDQLRALESFVQRLEEEFGQHNDIRPLMMRSFSPRHPNSARALANWERKSQYLLREVVKYKTYVEILSRALILRENLIAKALEQQKSSAPTSLAPEPWFDLSASAPTSVSTANTKETGGEQLEKGESVATN